MNSRENELRYIMQQARGQNDVRVVDTDDLNHHVIYRQAFNAVCNKTDWKAPVVAEVRDDNPNLGLYLESIRFMTGTEPTIFITGTCDDGHRMLTIVSEGYRIGPAGP